jgi:hypothetical protein
MTMSHKLTRGVKTMYEDRRNSLARAAVTRPAFKERYRIPVKGERSVRLPEPFPGFSRRRDDKEHRHLPFLHLQLPYTSRTLIELLLNNDRPIIDAEVQNNGNAPATTPVVELVTEDVASLPAHRDITTGTLFVGTLYPHQSKSVSVPWDWSRTDESKGRIYWLFLFAVLLYEPVLDPRPDRFANGMPVNVEDQPSHHIKVVTLDTLAV